MTEDEKSIWLVKFDKDTSEVVRRYKERTSKRKRMRDMIFMLKRLDKMLGGK